MVSETNLDLAKVLDRLEHGIIIFNSAGQMIYETLAAYTLLGSDLNSIRTNGWEAAAILFNTRQTDPDNYLHAVRDRATELRVPVRFHIFRSGELMPCWAVVFDDQQGDPCTMITLDVPDWTAMTSLVDRFQDEMTEAVLATQGHIDLIYHSIEDALNTDMKTLSRRVAGFARLIGVHMHRANRFLEMLERTEDIRLGRVKERARARRRKIDLADYLEDFVEDLDEIMLVDPETEIHDHRARLSLAVHGNPVLLASSYYLTRILRDVLRKAIMYSMVGTPIVIEARRMGQRVQIDVIDEGYGIRKREQACVFTPFQRARQPQVLAEFGYGLSLYLCRYEVEAMNGRIWYESEEAVGTTLSIMLPIWDDVSSSSSSSTTP